MLLLEVKCNQIEGKTEERFEKKNKDVFLSRLTTILKLEEMWQIQMYFSIICTKTITPQVYH